MWTRSRWDFGDGLAALDAGHGDGQPRLPLGRHIDAVIGMQFNPAAREDMRRIVTVIGLDDVFGPVGIHRDHAAAGDERCAQWARAP